MDYSYTIKTHKNRKGGYKRDKTKKIYHAGARGKIDEHIKKWFKLIKNKIIHIDYNQDNKKTGKSAERYELYKRATTLNEYKDIWENTIKSISGLKASSSATKDFDDDFTKKFVRILGWNGDTNTEPGHNKNERCELCLSDPEGEPAPLPEPAPAPLPEPAPAPLPGP